LPSKFQDFPGPSTKISRTFQVLEILSTEFQDFPGVGTLSTALTAETFLVAEGISFEN